MGKGNVFLVGAGPGDTGLITVKGLEAIKGAEVILYDRLANPKLLEFASPECELIYCGKLPDRHVLRQEMINSLLVEKALEGKTVVRLKGGDPGVFGRVGEEAEALAEHGICYTIVPGISSGIAAPVYAGIPVTHREFGESFAVVTAHDKSKDGHPDLDWKSLASGIDTIAFYMGISNLPFICENLVKHGKPSATPVILIQWGTFGRQKTLEGTLGDIAEKASSEHFSNPAITLVGEIVSLRGKLSWFEKKPLFGRQAIVARTGTAESSLAMEMTSQGADVIEFPKWKRSRVEPNQDILDTLSGYQRILFTSPESAGEFFDILIEEEMDIRSVKADLFGCSTKSVDALKKRGFRAEPESRMSSAGRLLIVGDTSMVDRPEYKHSEQFITSKKEIDWNYMEIFIRMIDEAEVNTLIFPSAASVRAVMEAGIKNKIIPSDLLDKAELVALGEKTALALKEYGLKADIVPAAPTKEALVESLQNSLNRI
ncbi:uroporphyrinogen-III C-methyltransferase [Bacillus sp. FJAT-27225]|uniref:uroporphyrinogen-III C-methyltransferase n=1 Tax=Bacillus sp. FJAT-27225 TaxID=1743144 RepID=UPI00080C22B9|nr:uroporphyrinogen-III C-methyltransferase [Bacillus sp. FJAT-27225]OCA85833.1 uroporphyrinogen-III C-methyltransferase [Bacillus sp. FJAT-27225]